MDSEGLRLQARLPRVPLNTQSEDVSTALQTAPTRMPSTGHVLVFTATPHARENPALLRRGTQAWLPRKPSGHCAALRSALQSTRTLLKTSLGPSSNPKRASYAGTLFYIKHLIHGVKFAGTHRACLKKEHPRDPRGKKPLQVLWCWNRHQEPGFLRQPGPTGDRDESEVLPPTRGD